MVNPGSDKTYQGVPKSLIMLATSHQTKAQFNA